MANGRKRKRNGGGVVMENDSKIDPEVRDCCLRSGVTVQLFSVISTVSFNYSPVNKQFCICDWVQLR